MTDSELLINDIVKSCELSAWQQAKLRRVFSGWAGRRVYVPAKMPAEVVRAAAATAVSLGRAQALRALAGMGVSRSRRYQLVAEAMRNG